MDSRDVELALALGCKVPDARLYRRNADALRRICDVWSMEPDSMVRLKADGFMDLIVERLNEDQASLSHYGEMNGDRMADPDVVIDIAKDGTWIRAVSYQNDYVGFYREYRSESDHVGLRDLNQFLATWLENIKDQGHCLQDPQGEGG